MKILKKSSLVCKNYEILIFRNSGYVNHFSHNGNPIHENLKMIVKEDNMKVSFDGLEIELL